MRGLPSLRVGEVLGLVLPIKRSQCDVKGTKEGEGVLTSISWKSASSSRESVFGGEEGVGWARSRREFRRLLVNISPVAVVSIVCVGSGVGTLSKSPASVERRGGIGLFLRVESRAFFVVGGPDSASLLEALDKYHASETEMRRLRTADVDNTVGGSSCRDTGRKGEQL